MEKKSQIIKEWDGYKFKLYQPAPDTKAKTHLYFNFPNPASGKNQVIRDGYTLTGKLSDRQLFKNAEILADSYIELIKKGWSPFIPTDKKILTSATNISDCIAHYVDIRKAQFDTKAISKNRYESIKAVLSKHFSQWLIANKYQFRKPSSFTYTDFKTFFDTYTNLKSWGKETYNTYRDVIKMFWIFLKEEKIVDDYNGIAKTEFKNTRNDSTHFKIYEEEELELVRKLLKAEPRWFNLHLSSKLLYSYNIRLEEQLKIQIEDYNPDTKVLTLPPHKTKNGDEARFQFDSEFAKIIESHIEGLPEEFYLIGINNKPRAERLAYGAIGQKWRKFRAEYDIPDTLKFYALKHSSSHYALEDGETIPQLQKRLRHVLESTTRRYQKGLQKKVITGKVDSRF
jgi:integrase